MNKNDGDSAPRRICLCDSETSYGEHLMEYLRSEGFSCYAASVAPEGSAWDRACELYAQLAGTVTDYGKAHSEQYGHERFGPDFTGRPLIPDWESGRKLVLLGHSFGGATIRLFSELLANGSAEEQAVTPPEELSPFFLGRQGERLHALVALAAPTNGTTAYDLYKDESFDVNSVKVSRWDDLWGNFFSNRKQAEKDGRSEDDYAAHDMYIDNAQALNARISTLPGTYYFAVPCSATEAVDGVQRPVRGRMEAMFRRTSARMGAYTGKTAGGVTAWSTPFPPGRRWARQERLMTRRTLKRASGRSSRFMTATIWRCRAA